MSSQESTSRELYLSATAPVPQSPPEPKPLVSKATEDANNEKIERIRRTGE